jgi:hypothetical protein
MAQRLDKFPVNFPEAQCCLEQFPVNRLRRWAHRGTGSRANSFEHSINLGSPHNMNVERTVMRRGVAEQLIAYRRND